MLCEAPVFTRPLIGSSINSADRLIGSPISWQSTARAPHPLDDALLLPLVEAAAAGRVRPRLALAALQARAAAAGVALLVVLDWVLAPALVLCGGGTQGFRAL